MRWDGVGPSRISTANFAELDWYRKKQKIDHNRIARAVFLIGENVEEVPEKETNGMSEIFEYSGILNGVLAKRLKRLMKNTKSICLGVLFVFVLMTALGRADKVHAVEYFITYGEATWAEEKAYLRNFAIAIKSDQDTVGYVGLFARRDEKPSEVRRRKARILRFLVEQSKIDKKRIVIRNLGKEDKRFTILQPIPRDADPPF